MLSACLCLERRPPLHAGCMSVSEEETPSMLSACLYLERRPPPYWVHVCVWSMLLVDRPLIVYDGVCAGGAGGGSADDCQQCSACCCGKQS